ncbi:Protein monoglycylase TTLL8 [Trachymyrmex septentrionalis]|uniref:Protein monoglycylase TTLL8 n=1 Tax=Trachymyrmex septentrionalis TaxID=34720 RepID=A0A151JTV3_9HYME|nr:Protein monoglycylase TTLL8 [Trachymyrmex septentrionalis]
MEDCRVSKTVLNCRTCVARNDALTGRCILAIRRERIRRPVPAHQQSQSTDQQAFVEDFQLTAGLLKWFVRGTTVAEEILVANSEKRRAIPIARLEFAIQRCEEFVAIATHEDIDGEKGEQPSDEEWNYFLNNHTAALHHKADIDSSSEKSCEKKSFFRNVSLRCGNGIVISHNLKDIMHKVEQKPKNYYIVQKYFDPWGHKGEPYYNLIYLKMTEAIVLIMLTAQNHMERRRCSFELYGADFMLAEDMSVWLIEINTNPRIHPSSSRLTRRLYSDVLESLVKVIMDVPVNACADTGGFSLVYKQDIPDFQPYLGPYLFVAGKSMTLHKQPPELTSEKERRANICGPWSK